MRKTSDQWAVTILWSNRDYGFHWVLTEGRHERLRSLTGYRNLSEAEFQLQHLREVGILTVEVVRYAPSVIKWLSRQGTYHRRRKCLIPDLQPFELPLRYDLPDPQEGAAIPNQSRAPQDPPPAENPGP